MNRKTTIQRWFLLFAAAIMLFGTQLTAQKLEISPANLDLGERPIEAWMRSEAFTLTNTSTDVITLNTAELDAPAFFGLDAANFPMTIQPGEAVEVYVNTNGTATAGLLEGDFVAQWGFNRDVTVAPLQANAYVPVQGDVFENPFEIAAFPFNAAAVSTVDFKDNYLLAGATADGFDAVYAFTLATDQLVSVNLTGADAKMAVYAPFGLNEGPADGNELYAAGTAATDMQLFAGDYYLVVSTTGAAYDLDVTTSVMPDAEAATYVAPADGAVDVINGTMLEWTFGNNTLEYQVVIGTTYPPATVVVDWTDDLATTFELSNLEPNLQYFWQVNTKNNNNANPTMGDIWGFTTTLTPPSDLTADAEVYEGEDVVLTWESPVDRAFLGYNIFRDGVKQNAAMLTEASYTDETPAYNMTGYEYTVTSIFDEGESAHSAPFTVQVTGEGTLNGNVTDMVTGFDIEGATVAIEGLDEFGVEQTYTATTDAAGDYTLDLLAGEYDLTVSMDGYINATLEGVVVTYDAATTEDFELLETAFPVDFVVAVEMDDDRVLLEWGWDAANFVPQQYPFDTKGMNAQDIEKMWSEFIVENNFTASGNELSDRALVEFEIYREKEYLPGTMELVGTTSQFNFVDFDWGVQDWGVYKWYVKAVYDLNGSDLVASNSLDKDMNTVVDVTVATNSADSPGGAVVSFTNISEPALNLEYAIVLGESGEYTWDAFRKGTYDIEVVKNGFASITETQDIFDVTSFEWLLEEILAVPANLYVTPTGFATWDAGVAGAFEPVMQDFNSGMPADWTIELGPNSDVADNWQWVEFYDSWSGDETLDNTPFMLIDSDGAGSGVRVDGYMTSSVVDASIASALYLEFDQYFNNISTDFANVEVFDGTDWVVVLNQTADAGDWSAPDHKVLDVTAYANEDFQVRFHYDDNNVYAWYWAIDNFVITDVPASTREFATYKLFLDEVLLGELTEEEYQYGTTFGETLVDGETYLAEVAAVYTTGQSDRAAFNWTYVACDNYDVPADFAAAQLVGTLDIELTWTNVDADALDTIAAARIYRNGEVYAELDFTTEAVESFLDEELEFGTYNYCVTYIYDSGAETCQGVTCSEDVVITGGGYVDGTVTAFVGDAAIEGATVTFANDDYSFDFTTDAAGLYAGEVVEGTYTVTASANTYESQTIEGIAVAFGETVTNDFALLEFPYPAGPVVATELSDDVVQLNWSGTGGGGSTEDFFEGFEAGTLPTGWVTYDEDGDTYNWENTAIEFDIFEAHDGLYCMTSASYLNTVGALTPNNWLVTPAMDITAASELKFWVAAQDADWSDEQYYVKVSTTGNAVADFTETLHDAVSPAAWGEVTLDLSAYAGQTIYIAFQHADVTDMYFIKIDDVTVTNTETRAAYTEPVLAGNSTAVPFKTAGMTTEAVDAKMAAMETASSRELTGYSIYRTTCETGELQFLGFTVDQQFTDNTWGGVESGVYKWGVVAEYDLNQAEVTFSNCLDKDMITQVSVSVSTNSGDSPEGTDVTFTNTSEPGLELVYEVELDETGYYAWDEFRKGTYDIFVELRGFETVELTGVDIQEAQDFVWILNELLYPVGDLYVTPTAFATWRQGGIVPFEGFAENFDEGIPETWTIIPGGSTADTWYMETPAGNPQSAGASLDGTPFAYVDSDEAGIGSTMDEILISPVIDASTAEQLFLHFDQYYNNLSSSEYAKVEVFDGSDWVTVLNQTADAGAWDAPNNQVLDVTEYMNETFQIRFHYFSPGWNWYWAIDNVVVTETDESERALQYYKVWLDGNFIADTENTFYQYDVDGLVEGEEYFSEVAAIYSNGMSEKMSYTWTYYSCENYPGPENLAGEVDGQEVTLTWGGSTPPPPPGEAFEEGFEGAFPPADWAKLSPDGGTGWSALAVGTTPVPGWTGGEATAAPDGGSSMAYASWEGGGASANDMWLVTPQLTAAAGEMISFYLRYWPDAYADNVQILISTASQTSTGDFDIVVDDIDFGTGSSVEWELYTYDLEDFVDAGTPYYLAFRETVADNFNDGAAIFLDNVYVGPATQRAQPLAEGIGSENIEKVVTQVAASNNIYAESNDVATDKRVVRREMWDLEYSFDIDTPSGLTGLAGAETDGEFIYATKWSSSSDIVKFTMDGTYVETFQIPGVSSVRDMAFDGTYMYGAAASTTVFQMDFTNKTLVGTITAPTAVRAIAYDDVNDAFWGNNFATDMVLFDRTGATLNTIVAPPSMYGAAYDNFSEDGPFLWFFTGTTTGAGCQVEQYDIAAGALTGVSHSVSADLGDYIAGGLYIYEDLDTEKVILGGTAQGTPDLAFGYELIDNSTGGGGGGGDFETGELLGANVYRDGELIAEMVTDEIYVDEDVAYGMHEYCVTFVYESGAESCAGNCIDVEVVYPCDAPKDLTGEYLWTEEAFGAMIAWNSPQDAIAEWLFYDDGVNVDGIGGPATFTWAIKFDPAQLAEFDGASLTKIEIYNRVASSNELRIYEGTNAATLLHTQTLSGLGIETWEEVELTDAVLIDVTKELWIAVYTTDGVSYPAGCGDYTGNPNSDLITLDGVLWEHLNDLGLAYTWNLRGFVTTAAGTMAAIPMEIPVDKYNSDDQAALAVSGEGAGENAVLDITRNRELDVFNVYRSENGADYSLIATVPFEEGVSEFGYYDTDAAIGEYYYQVTAAYTYEGGSCESEPAMALENPEDDFVYVFITNINETGAAEARLFPNPASDMVNIEATGINRVTVINAVGQVVYDIEVDAAKTQLNTASLESGVYMVRINTENGMVTKRMSIVR